MLRLLKKHWFCSVLNIRETQNEYTGELKTNSKRTQNEVRPYIHSRIFHIFIPVYSRTTTYYSTTYDMTEWRDMTWLARTYWKALHCSITYYNVLQRISFQRSTTYYNVLQRTTKYHNVLQHITMYNNVRQRITAHYYVLQRTTKYHNVLKRTTTYYNVLQRISTS